MNGNFKFVKIKVDHLVFRYHLSAENLLNGISFELNCGEAAVVAGPLASGKSTLGMLIKGFLEPISGEIALVGEDGNELNAAKDRLSLVGWVDARPERQLFATTVFEEVAFGLRQRGLDEMYIKKRVDWALEQVKLSPEEFIARSPYYLSGGEKRRLAIAGIIAMDYPFYIFDDVTIGLDDDGVKDLISLIGNLINAGRGIMLIGHDLDFFKALGYNKLWQLKDGRLYDFDIKI